MIMFINKGLGQFLLISLENVKVKKLSNIRNGRILTRGLFLLMFFGNLN